MSHNMFQFIGNLTRDTELHNSQGGSSRAIFDVAVNRTWGKGADKQEKRSFSASSRLERRRTVLAVTWGKVPRYLYRAALKTPASRRMVKPSSAPTLLRKRLIT